MLPCRHRRRARVTRGASVPIEHLFVLDRSLHPSPTRNGFRPSVPPCSPGSHLRPRRRRSTRSPWRSTFAGGFAAFTWSAFRPCRPRVRRERVRAAVLTRASSVPQSGSRSISRPRTCARPGRVRSRDRGRAAGATERFPRSGRTLCAVRRAVAQRRNQNGSGALAVALGARRAGFSNCGPERNAGRPRGSRDSRVAAWRLSTAWRSSARALEPRTPAAEAAGGPDERSDDLDLATCAARRTPRALLIAAAGGHNVLMIGPPGAARPCSRGAARHPPAELRGSASGHPGPQRGGGGERRPCHQAALPGASPHDLSAGPGRRGRPAPAG